VSRESLLVLPQEAGSSSKRKRKERGRY